MEILYWREKAESESRLNRITTFVLELLIGAIVMFRFNVKHTKEIVAKTTLSILEECVDKIKLYDWNIAKTIDYLNNTSNKLKIKK